MRKDKNLIIVFKKKESEGKLQADGGTGVNWFSRVWGGEQMFKLGWEICINEITINRIVFDR